MVPKHEVAEHVRRAVALMHPAKRTESHEALVAMSVMDQLGWRVRFCWVVEEGLHVTVDHPSDHSEHEFRVLTHAGRARRAAAARGADAAD